MLAEISKAEVTYVAPTPFASWEKAGSYEAMGSVSYIPVCLFFSPLRLSTVTEHLEKYFLLLVCNVLKVTNGNFCNFKSIIVALR